MRADRLLSLLLLLQTRGRMTAQALAQELEVSERTIYRDVDALGTSGVPVYGERGPEGGYALLDGYRTSLTGLTTDEMRAFFMLSMPAPLADLGVGADLKAALLKLSAALPSVRRDEEERVCQRFHLDATWWGQGAEPAPHVQTIQQAVWQDGRLAISYDLPQAIHIEQVVDAHGLVAKAGVWYLVYAVSGRLRAVRVSQLQSVRTLDETFVRKSADLAAFWQQWCATVESHRLDYRVTARLAPSIASRLSLYFGRSMGDSLARATAGADGWLTIELAFESFFEARTRLLGCGRDVEVLAPEPLRQSILDFASQIVSLYAPRSEQ